MSRHSWGTLFFLITFFPIISTKDIGAASYDPIPPPQFHRQALLNGMEILFLPTDEARALFVLMIRNGAVFDPIGKWGVTYLTTRMIVEQTQNQSGLPVQRNLQQFGAEVDFRVDRDAIFFFGSAPTEQIGDVLGVLGEMIVRPNFSEEDLVRLRERLIQEVEQERQNPEVLTQEIFLSELFQENPYAHTVKGTSQTLKNLNVTDIKIQYRKLFLPNQAQLALYHSGSRDLLFTALSRSWGGWVKDSPLPFTFRPASPPAERLVRLVESSPEQSLFRWGNLSVEMGSREFYALKIFEEYLTLHLPGWANQVAGADRIRGSCELQAGMMPGYLQVNIQAPPDRLFTYLRQLETFLKDLHQGQIDPERFEEARELAWWELRESLQEPLPRLYLLLDTTLYNLGINFITHYGTRLSRVTPEDFQKTVQKHLPLDNFLLVVAGPGQELKSELQSLGELHRLN